MSEWWAASNRNARADCVGIYTESLTPELRQYLLRELKIAEVRPESIVPGLNLSFLESQSDEWIEQLYEFLHIQAALRPRLGSLPLVRLNDGSHVVARINGEPQAFLPSNIETGFPTVRKRVCINHEARSFLVSLGITEPDLIDDVIFNVLQKYRSYPIKVDAEQYAKDIARIVTSFKSDSITEAQRRKLLAALRETTFVMVVDAGDGKKYCEKPERVYIATERLKRLFDGIPNVLIVDSTYAALRGEEVRELLEACGAVRYPRPLEAPQALSQKEQLELRRNAGHEATSGINDQVVDWLLQGIDKLIEILPGLPSEERTERAGLLWESLSDLEERRGRGVFEGSYKWTHKGSYTKEFPSAFIRRLNDAAWVPDANHELHPPRHLIFDNLGWKQNPFLSSKIQFKPPIIDQLARAAGIDPAALDLLRDYGITSVEDLKLRLGISDVPPKEEEGKVADRFANSEPTDTGDVYDDARDLYGDDMPEIPAGTPDPDSGDVQSWGGSGSGNRSAQGARVHGTGGHYDPSNGAGPGKRIIGSSENAKRGLGDNRGTRTFISYIGTHGDDEETDPDGLDQAARMHLEELAINKIIEFESILKRTPRGNPGYDLFEPDETGNPVRWIEVKSMTGSLQDRPVGLSHTQFELAWERRGAYWLYVVEFAGDSQRARLLRIRDPAGKARTYTLDSGWTQIADVELLCRTSGLRE